MVYVALLRGINVGGNNKVPMAQLKQLFEKLGFAGVKTFIASGNVIFSSNSGDETQLIQKIQKAIHKEFGFEVNVLLRNFDQFEKLVKAIPKSWVNDKVTKCDVMFLWPEADSPEILQQFSVKPEIEDLKYFPGAVVWRTDRVYVHKSRIYKIIGTRLYKQLTIRNPNTVRKIYELMREANQATS